MEPLLHPFFKSADATSALVNSLCGMVKRASATGSRAERPLMLLSVVLEQVPVIAPKKIRVSVVTAIQKQHKVLLGAVQRQQQQQEQQGQGMDAEVEGEQQQEPTANFAVAAVERISNRLAAVQVQ